MYSTMNATIFTVDSDLDHNKVKEIIKESGCGELIFSEKDVGDTVDYYFVFWREDQVMEIIPAEGDYYATHENARALAHAISQLIAPEGNCLLKFTADDGDIWGFYVRKNTVLNLGVQYTVEGIPLDLYGEGLWEAVYYAARVVHKVLDITGLAPQDGDGTLCIAKLFHAYLDNLQGNLNDEEYNRLLEKIEKEVKNYA